MKERQLEDCTIDFANGTASLRIVEQLFTEEEDDMAADVHMYSVELATATSELSGISSSMAVDLTLKELEKFADTINKAIAKAKS